MSAPEVPRLDVTHMAVALATVECDESHFDHGPGGVQCLAETCNGTGRVPASLPLRVVVDEPLTGECPECEGFGFSITPEGVARTFLARLEGAPPGSVGTSKLDPCPHCTDGRVPLTEDVTVALTQFQHRRPKADWEPCTDTEEASTLHRVRTVAVGTASGGQALPIVDDYEPLADVYEGPAAVEVTPYGHLLFWPEWDGAVDEDEVIDVTEWLTDGQDWSPGRWVYVFPTWTPEPSRG